jgi:HEAT repeat protein
LLAFVSARDGEVAAACASALGQLKDGRALKPLLALAGNAPVEVRLAALRGLGAMRMHLAPEQIEAFSQDSNADVREAAIWLLASLDRGGLLSLTIILEASNDAHTRDLVERALQSRTGRRLNGDVAAWRDYIEQMPK